MTEARVKVSPPPGGLRAAGLGVSQPCGLLRADIRRLARLSGWGWQAPVYRAAGAHMGSVGSAVSAAGRDWGLLGQSWQGCVGGTCSGPRTMSLVSWGGGAVLGPGLWPAGPGRGPDCVLCPGHCHLSSVTQAGAPHEASSQGSGPVSVCSGSDGASAEAGSPPSGSPWHPHLSMFR